MRRRQKCVKNQANLGEGEMEVWANIAFILGPKYRRCPFLHPFRLPVSSLVPYVGLINQILDSERTFLCLHTHIHPHFSTVSFSEWVRKRDIYRQNAGLSVAKGANLSLFCAKTGNRIQDCARNVLRAITVYVILYRPSCRQSETTFPSRKVI